MEAIERYLAGLPQDQRSALQHLRELILGTLPGIEEQFAYGMPAFRYNGHPLLYIGAARRHCALYGSIPSAFKERLKGFNVSKGAVQFTPDKRLPAAVVKAIVRAKAAEIDERWGAHRRPDDASPIGS